jgi:acid phosphatase
LKIPLYAALGNHDWRGNPEAQIAFTQKDPFWKMPAHNYSFHYPIEGAPLVEVFVIDSEKFDEAGEAWLQKAVAASTARWKILAFHHPLLDNGEEHPADEKQLWPKLKKIVCNKIDLFLGGHEHIFSHLQETIDGCPVEQVIIGTGGKELYGIKPIPPPGVKVFYSESRFGVGFFEISENRMKLTFYRADGTSSYHAVWKKP